MNAQPNAFGRSMRPRKLKPVLATAPAAGSARDITLASFIEGALAGRAARVGRLVNIAGFLQPDCSLAAAMPRLTGEVP